MREFFYAAMLSCTGTIFGLLLFSHVPGPRPATPTPSAERASAALPEHGIRMAAALLGGR